MPRRNLSVLSSGEDPYTLNRFPQAFAVTIGKQTYNARQLAKAAKVKGQWLDMYRQPIPAAKVREILALTRQRPRANTGRFMPASQLAKLRKLAKRELLARRGKRVVGPMSYDPRARQLGRLSHRASSSDDDYSNSNSNSDADLGRPPLATVRPPTVPALSPSVALELMEHAARLQYREVAASGVFAGYTSAQKTAVFQEIRLRIMHPHGAPTGTRLAELRRRVRNASAQVATEVLPPRAMRIQAGMGLNFSPARMALARAQLDLTRARQSPHWRRTQQRRQGRD